MTDGEILTADVAIVGSGAAGISLARRLSGRGMSVILLESGGRTLELDAQELNAGAIIGLPYFPLQGARLRSIGGTTNHWSGTCRPFEPFDLQEHAWIPDSGWPISVHEIEPYYAEAAEICGLPSTIWDAEHWIEASPYPAIETDAARVENRVAQNVRARRRRFAERFEADLERPATTVVTNATVVDIVLGEQLDDVDRLALRTLAGTEFSVRARAHVLAAGGLENARVLLNATGQLPAGIGNGTDQVGRYFLEHPRFVAGTLVPFRSDIDLRFYDTHDAGGSRITGYLSLPPAVRANEEIVDVQFRLEPRYPAYFQRAVDSSDVDALRELVGIDEEAPELTEDLTRVVDDLTSWRDFVAFGAPIPIPLPDVVGRVAGAPQAQRSAVIPELFGDIATLVYGQGIGPIPTDTVDVTARIEPVPNPASRVVLTDERDAVGARRLALDWRLSELDRRSVIRAVELLGAELGRIGLGRIRLTLDANDASWPTDLAGGYHHMGTTRMHSDPRRGVVDETGRIHGIRNLYVAGSSTFPTAGSGTPTMTIVALALRLADHLEASAR